MNLLQRLLIFLHCMRKHVHFRRGYELCIHVAAVRSVTTAPFHTSLGASCASNDRSPEPLSLGLTEVLLGHERSVRQLTVGGICNPIGNNSRCRSSVSDRCEEKRVIIIPTPCT
jgi:hypothetical protein